MIRSQLSSKSYEGFGYLLNPNGSGYAGYWSGGKRNGPAFIFSKDELYFGIYKDAVLQELQKLGFASQSTEEEKKLVQVYNFYKDKLIIKIADPDNVNIEVSI